MTLGNIHSIESFGTVDGPGVRLVVFVQGCPMRCLYCHNPDTWKLDAGTKMSSDEIIELYKRNQAFYKNGGITISGGEPLLQVEFLTELFIKAKENGIHTCIDSSGIAFNRNQIEKFEKLAKYTDLVLLDIKQINSQKHQMVTQHDNKNILDFAKWLDEKEIPVWIRHVYVNKDYSTEKDLTELGEFLGSLKNIKAVDVLPYHTMGKVKYQNLQLDYPLQDIPDASMSDAKLARTQILKGMKNTRNKTTG